MELLRLLIYGMNGAHHEYSLGRRHLATSAKLPLPIYADVRYVANGITFLRYASLKQLEAATPKVKSVLAPMKQFMAGPPAPLTGEKIFSRTN